MIKSKYFSEAEMQRCTPPCSLQQMNQQTLNKADLARQIAGIPFVVNCAYRSREYDLSKGRNGNSAHTRGRALDFRCNDSGNRFKMVDALYAAGFRRIGIGKTFIHADDDPTLPQNVMWHYYE